jgi:sugar-specific transcriptional regulator TrmB
MKRSYNSLTSLTSLTSINSRTKIYKNRDFQKYIGNIEEDLIKIIDKYDNKINKLYIDLRYRESDYIRLNNKIEYIIKDFNKYKINNYISIINYDFKYTDNILLYIQIFLYSYTTLILIIIFIVLPFIKY